MQKKPQACVWMEICSPRADNLGVMVGYLPIWAVYNQLYEISALTAFKICLKVWNLNYTMFVSLLTFALKLNSQEYISLIFHHSSHPQTRCVRCWAEGKFTYCTIFTKPLCHFSLFVCLFASFLFLFFCTNTAFHYRMHQIQQFQLTGHYNHPQKLIVNRFIGKQSPIQMWHKKLIVFNIKCNHKYKVIYK